MWKLYILFSIFQCLSNKSNFKQTPKIMLQLVCRILLYQVPQSTLNPPTKSIFIFCIVGTVLAPVDWIICWKKKVIPWVGGYESLKKCVTYKAAKSLQDAAIWRSDNPQMLAQISGVSIGNLVAREVWYHRTCFQNYTHKPKAPATTTKNWGCSIHWSHQTLA